MTAKTQLGLLLLGVAVLIAGFPRGAEVLAEELEEQPIRVTWRSFRDARALGRDDGRPILVHFTTVGVELSGQMDRETYTDRRVIRYLDRHFALARVDVNQLPSLARKYQVKTLPTLWFLDSSGRALTRISGFVDPDKLLRISEFVQTRAYEFTDYETWRARRKGP